MSAPRESRVAPIAVYLVLFAVAGAPIGLAGESDGGTSDESANAYLTDPEAINLGRRFYRSRCIICHLKAGGRGPKIFRSDLTHEQFLEVVINGRDGTQMPAFGERMSPDDVWAVHAFVMSRDRY